MGDGLLTPESRPEGMHEVVRLIAAGAMAVGGALLALAGMGFVGESSAPSTTWSMIGALIAGLGVALGITALQRRRP